MEYLIGRDIEFLAGVEEFDAYPETGMRATVKSIIPYPEEGLFEVVLDYTKYESYNSSLESLRYFDKKTCRYLSYRLASGYESQESYCVSIGFDRFALLDEMAAELVQLNFTFH